MKNDWLFIFNEREAKIANRHTPYRIESRVVVAARGDVTRGLMIISENCFFGGNGGGSVCKVASGLGGGSGTTSPYESFS